MRCRLCFPRYIVFQLAHNNLIPATIDSTFVDTSTRPFKCLATYLGSIKRKINALLREPERLLSLTLGGRCYVKDGYPYAMLEWYW